MRFLILALLATAMLAGCTDDAPADDDHGDGCDHLTGAAHDECHAAEDEGDHMDEAMPLPVHTVSISWDGAYQINGAYSASTITVPANHTIELTFTNNDPAISHDFVVEGIEGASTSVIGPGQSETITFDVGEAMETKFFCAVGTHRQNGMEGDFIVE